MIGKKLNLLLFAFWTNGIAAWAPANGGGRRQLQERQLTLATVLRATPTKEPEKAQKNLEETTEKFGLEVGLLESLKQKDGGATAKSLLKRYGIAYLATSIPLALVSFAICYALVDNGVDVGGLLSNVGIEVNQGTETAGTFAIAYAAHKAASPIRFPPTVLLTPVVAKLIGKEPEEQDQGES